jgi:hypothetical protein
MGRTSDELGALTRHERHALRALLVAAVRASGQPDGRTDLAGLVAAAPVRALPAAAALHRVSGSVQRGIDGVPGVPDEVHGALRSRRDQSAFHHLLIVGALHQIAARFDAAALSWVVMKGPVAAALLYPGPGDRSYGDLDLLVARQDYPQAMRILEELGYQHDVHNWALAEELLAGQVGMATPAVHVDLHWHLHYSQEDRRPFAFPIDLMLERRRRVPISGVATPTFDAVDTMLTLAFHAARSDGHRMVWFKDVERSAVVDEPHLDDLVRRCRDYRCDGPVGLILDRARYLLDAPIPVETVSALLPRSLRIAEHLTTRVENPVQLHERGTVTRWFTHSVRASIVGSVVAMPERAARSVKRSLFPPAENETDDPAEKASYLRAVARSDPGPFPA